MGNKIKIGRVGKGRFALGSKKVGSVARQGLIVDRKTRLERGAMKVLDAKVREAEAAVKKLEKEIGIETPVARAVKDRRQTLSRVTVKRRGSVQVRLRKRGAVPQNKLPKHVRISAKARELRQLTAEVRTYEYQRDELKARVTEQEELLKKLENLCRQKAEKINAMLTITGGIKAKMLEMSVTLAEFSKTVAEAADVDEETKLRANVEALLCDELSTNPMVETFDIGAFATNDGTEADTAELLECYDENTIEDGIAAEEFAEDAETQAMFEITPDVDPLAQPLGGR